MGRPSVRRLAACSPGRPSVRPRLAACSPGRPCARPLLAALWLVVARRFAEEAAAAAPNIVVVIGDDVGLGGVGWHAQRNRPANGSAPLIQTPRIDGLVASGLEIDRHYVYGCSPRARRFRAGASLCVAGQRRARAAQRGGRQRVCEIPTSMTGVASVLRASPRNTRRTAWKVGRRHGHAAAALGRGYTSWLGYFHHANDYYTEGLPLRLRATSTCASTGLRICGDPDNTPPRISRGAACTRRVFTNQTLSVSAHAAASRRPAAEQQPLFLVTRSTSATLRSKF